MNEKRKRRNKEKKVERKRLEDARRSFEKMQEEIAPFIKRRELGEISTAGRWREGSSLYSEKPK